MRGHDSDVSLSVHTERTTTAGGGVGSSGWTVGVLFLSEGRVCRGRRSEAVRGGVMKPCCGGLLTAQGYSPSALPWRQTQPQAKDAW